MRYFIIIFIFLIIATISIMGFRGSKSLKPPLEVFPDMDRMGKYKPQAENSFFADGMADRPAVPGTIAASSFNEDQYFTSGKISDQWGKGFPVTVNHELIQLGEEKFNIHCSICHGLSGDGNGITKSYGMIATPNYHSDRLRGMPEGEIFNTITYGRNTTGAYGVKLRIHERWAVIAYIRTLQRSRNARPEDVPQDSRGILGL